jgi:TPR repeat protein
VTAKTASLMSSHGRLWYDDPIYRASWIIAPQCIFLVLLVWMFGASPRSPSVPWGKPSVPSPAQEQELISLRDHANTSRDAMTKLEGMAATGDPLANFYMGTLYDPVFKLSKIVSPDVDKSISYYQVAANGGINLAHENLMNFYFLQKYGRADWVKGCNVANNPVVLSSRFVERYRGYCYAGGWGTTKPDLVKAVAAFRVGAEKGDARSQAELGAYYTTGEGNLPRDYEMAVRLYKQSADQNDPLGIYNLGSCYDFGCGPLQKNPAEAVRLITLALDSKYDVVMDRKFDVAINVLTTKPDVFSPQFWQELQRQLAQRNVYSGPLDGTPNPTLMSAIKRMGAPN